MDGRRIPLVNAVTVIGRAGDVDVPLDDAGVSRRHAEIHLADGRARVVDLGSTNGTFVDGERVSAGELRDGSTDHGRPEPAGVPARATVTPGR